MSANSTPTHNTLSLRRDFLLMLEGDAVAAVLLSQIVFWASHTSDVEGWFWKSYPEWEVETGFSRAQIDRAAAKLETFGVERCTRTNTRRKGNAPVHHYRVNQAELDARIGLFVQNGRSNPEASIHKAASTCNKVAPSNPVQGVENSHLEPASFSHLERARNSQVLNTTEPTTVTTAAGNVPDANTGRSVSMSPPADAQKQSPETKPVPLSLLDTDAAALARLTPEEGLRRFRAEHPDADATRAYHAKLAEIRNRPGLRWPNVVSWCEVRDVVLPDLREKREAAAKREAERQNAPRLVAWTDEEQAAYDAKCREQWEREKQRRNSPTSHPRFRPHAALVTFRTVSQESGVPA